MEGNKFRSVEWTYQQSFNAADNIGNWAWTLFDLSGVIFAYLSFYVNRLILPLSTASSVVGFSLLLGIVFQLLSGFFLGWYYIPEPGLVIALREEMFADTRFGTEIFLMHVRGVDALFVLSYAHILKKIYLKNYIIHESDGWILGGYAFLWFHYVVMLGISLSATHLSDLTVTIIANIFWSVFDNIYKTYYIIFTNKHLNVDQMARLMVLHYFTPWYYLYLIQLHIMFCHESWDTDSGETVYEDKSGSYITWFYDAFLKEIQDAWYSIIVLFIIFIWHGFFLTTVSYIFFERWNIAEFDEIRFYGVAPHWYFRPLMGLLIVTPTHYEGLAWMVGFLVLLTFLPLFYNWYSLNYRQLASIPMQHSLVQTFFFILFMLSLFCTSSMLPCGRYYYEPEGGYSGNVWVKFSWQFIFLYLIWLIHHLDRVEHFTFQFFRQICNKYFNLPSQRLIRLIQWRWVYVRLRRKRHLLANFFQTGDYLINFNRLTPKPQPALVPNMSDTTAYERRPKRVETKPWNLILHSKPSRKRKYLDSSKK